MMLIMMIIIIIMLIMMIIIVTAARPGAVEPGPGAEARARRQPGVCPAGPPDNNSI